MSFWILIGPFGAFSLIRVNHFTKPLQKVRFSQASPFTRVSIAIQFTSQFLPPSSENACSKRHESGVTSDITNRTRMARPFIVSWEKNSPRPLLNSPMVGGLKVPLLLPAKFKLHWRGCGFFKDTVQTLQGYLRALNTPPSLFA